MNQKPKMNLISHDGNIFSIMGRAAYLLRQEGLAEQVDEMNRRVRASGDYNEALHIISEYVETELSPTAEIRKNTRRRNDLER